MLFYFFQGEKKKKMIQKTISFSIYPAHPKLTFSKGPKSVLQDKDTAQKIPNTGVSSTVTTISTSFQKFLV